MGMKRYVAANMQAALKQIRDELGADASILSTQKVDGGVEVICATEDMVRKPRPSAPQETRPQQAPSFQSTLDAAVAPERPPVSSLSQALLAAENERRQAARQEPVISDTETDRVLAEARREEQARREQEARQRTQEQAQQQQEMSAMREELKQLRDLIRELPLKSASAAPVQSAAEPQKASPVQSAPAKVTAVSQKRRHPFYKRLRLMGFGGELVQKWLSQLAPENNDLVWQQALETLSRDLPVAEREPLADKGIFMMLGAPGAGKTTTIAKLATRYVMQYGAERLALVTTDRYRLAGSRQLQTLGQLLKVDVLSVGVGETLDDVLDKVADRSLVLVDTAGLSPSDEGWQDQLDTLNCERHRISRCLVLPASSQGNVLKASLRAWAPLGLDFSILTKLDEAWALGEILSVVTQAECPVAYFTDGQQISANLHRASQRNLVGRTLEKWRAAEGANESGQQITGDQRKVRQDLVV